jgi:hypothetical protein
MFADDDRTSTVLFLETGKEVHMLMYNVLA